MPTSTITKTKTRTKLLVATLALAAAGGLAFILTPASSPTATLPYSCSDPDGSSTTTAGMAQLLSGGKVITYAVDYCSGTSQVVEQYCNTPSSFTNFTATCSLGCKLGACVMSPAVIK